MSKRNGRKLGVAFGFIPIYWDGDTFESRNWFFDILIDISLCFVDFFMPDALENGVPLKIFDDN